MSLLKNIPDTCRHLIVKNPTHSTNNLVFDNAQLNQNKYNTKSITKLSLEGFDINLKQITDILNRNLFRNLRDLHITANNIYMYQNG